MPESREGRELTGLARSIDALFTRLPARPPETEPEREPEPDTTTVEPTPAPPDPPIQFAVPAPVEPVPEVELPHDLVEEPSEPAVEGAAPLEPSDVHRSPPTLDAAIDAYLAGDPGAASEVRAAAATLRERLVLDPLADAVERLVHAAGDPPDPPTLALAQEVINPAVASRIVQRIGNERDEERRAEYVQLSRRLGRVMAMAFKGALTDVTDEGARRAYHDNLIAMGSVSRPIVEGMIQDENRFLVSNGVAILSEMGGEGAAALVTTALADTDPRVRREGLLALARVGDESSAPLVVGLLDDPDDKVRSAAAVAAGALKVERAQRKLIAMLEEARDPDTQMILLRSLGQLEDPGAVQAIEKLAVRSLFAKPPAEVRITAYQALHRMGTPHARQLIQAALSDKDAAVQAAVRRLLRSDDERTSGVA